MKNQDLLLEFANAHGAIIDSIITSSFSGYLEINKLFLNALSYTAIYTAVCDLIWKGIINNKQIISDPAIRYYSGRKGQQQYLIYKQQLVISISKTDKNGKVRASRHSNCAVEFFKQENLSFLKIDENQVHSYIYYSTDASGYEIEEIGIQCPKGNGVHFMKVPFFGDIATQQLMFPCSQNNTAYEDIQKQKAKFKKKNVTNQ